MVGKGKPGPAPGQRFGGRRKGTPNRLTGDVRAMILAALDEVGGHKYLVEEARANPTAFLTLVGKVLPMQVNATVKRDLRELSKAEILALIDRPGIDGQTSGEDEPRAVH